MAEQSDIEKLRELMSGARIAMLTTRDSGGNLLARPMTLQQFEFDGDLWFFTARDSAKLAHVTADPHVNVSFDNNGSWVSMSGTAQAVDDSAKTQELWNPIVKAYFPNGPDDPELTLLKVDIHGAQYWDSDNKVVTLFKVAKAAATNERVEMGESGTMDL